MTRRLSVLSTAACLLYVSACHRDKAGRDSLPEAQFGIFFGGQLQQRQDLPLEPDESRQQQGFRLVFRQPAPRPFTIAWELDYPTARSTSRSTGTVPRARRKQQAELPAGADRFEQRITLSPKDVLGDYSLRVFVDNELVLERPFRLVAPGNAGK